MRQDQEVTTLEQLLDRIGKATQGGGRVSLGAVLDVLGRRSFAPLLLVAGVVTLAPHGLVRMWNFPQVHLAALAVLSGKL